MIGEIIGELFHGIVRIAVSIIVDVIFEIFVKGVGYFICRRFEKSVNPDGVAVIVVGIIVWSLIGLALYFSYGYVHRLERVA